MKIEELKKKLNESETSQEATDVLMQAYKEAKTPTELQNLENERFYFDVDVDINIKNTMELYEAYNKRWFEIWREIDERNALAQSATERTFVSIMEKVLLATSREELDEQMKAIGDANMNGLLMEKEGVLLVEAIEQRCKLVRRKKKKVA